MKTNTATWYSIFGQIEEVVAKAMIAEGKLRPLSMFPGMPNEYNERGEFRRMLVHVPRQFDGEFNQRCADLRA